VRAVTGTRDPREGRLVIHGWFVQPRPFVIGPLRPRALEERVGELGREVGALPVAGLLSLAFATDRGGAPRRVHVLSDTTRVARGDERERVRMVRRILAAVASWRFGRQRGPSTITLPLVFERGG
jgi:hypothetical protein